MHLTKLFVALMLDQDIFLFSSLFYLNFKLFIFYGIVLKILL